MAKSEAGELPIGEWVFASAGEQSIALVFRHRNKSETRLWSNGSVQREPSPAIDWKYWWRPEPDPGPPRPTVGDLSYGQWGRAVGGSGWVEGVSTLVVRIGPGPVIASTGEPFPDPDAFLTFGPYDSFEELELRDRELVTTPKNLAWTRSVLDGDAYEAKCEGCNRLLWFCGKAAPVCEACWRCTK